jgi:hypothetical protein
VPPGRKRTPLRRLELERQQRRGRIGHRILCDRFIGQLDVEGARAELHQLDGIDQVQRQP